MVIAIRKHMCNDCLSEQSEHSMCHLPESIHILKHWNALRISGSCVDAITRCTCMHAYCYTCYCWNSWPITSNMIHVFHESTVVYTGNCSIVEMHVVRLAFSNVRCASSTSVLWNSNSIELKPSHLPLFHHQASISWSRVTSHSQFTTMAPKKTPQAVAVEEPHGFEFGGP